MADTEDQSKDGKTETPEPWTRTLTKAFGVFVMGVIGGGTSVVYLGDRLFPPNQEPEVQLVSAQRSAHTGIEVVFNALAHDREDGRNLFYEWTKGATIMPETGPSFTTTFEEPGRYTITVTVTDSGNNVVPEFFTFEATDPFNRIAHNESRRDVELEIAAGEFQAARWKAENMVRQCDKAPADKCAESHFLLAEARRLLGRFGEAQQSMTEALNRVSDDPKYRISYAILEMLNEDYEGAATGFVAYRDDHPEDRKGLLLLGLAHGLAGAPDEAVDVLEALARKQVETEADETLRLKALLAARMIALGQTPPENVAETRAAIEDILAQRRGLVDFPLGGEPSVEPLAHAFRRLAVPVNTEIVDWLSPILEDNRCN